MNVPSLKRLEREFPGKGEALREVFEWLPAFDPYKVYAAYQRWIDKCHHRPQKLDQQMFLLNIIIDGFGVESIQEEMVFGRPAMQYVNMGDTYNKTIIWDDGRKTWFIESYGDWVEKAERRGLKFE